MFTEDSAVEDLAEEMEDLLFDEDWEFWNTTQTYFGPNVSMFVCENDLEFLYTLQTDQGSQTLFCSIFTCIAKSVYEIGDIKPWTDKTRTGHMDYVTVL